MSEINQTISVERPKRLLNVHSAERAINLEPTELNDSEVPIDIEEVYSKELAEIRQRAEKEGYENGQVKAKNQIDSEVEKTVSLTKKEYEEKLKQLEGTIGSFTQLMESVNQCKHMSSHEMEAAIVSIVINCLFKLTGEKDIYDSMVKASVKKAIAAMPESSSITLKINPADDALIRSVIDQIESDQCKVVTEPSLKQGACLVESGFSSVDLSLTSQLEQLANTLKDVYVSRVSQADD